MGSAPTGFVSVEEYLARTEKPNAEYEDGVVYPKPWPLEPHSFVQTRCMLLLDRQGVLALPELTMRTSPTRCLVPDVVVVNEIPARYPTEPPVLCVEILSAEQGLGEMLYKCEKYHAWGVPYCWVIDPGKRTAWEYHKGGEPVKVSASLQAGQLNVTLSDLFADLTPRA